jgi:hypothetical protein
VTNNDLPIGNFIFRQRQVESRYQLDRNYDIIVAGLSWEDRGTFGLASLSEPPAGVTLLKFRSKSEATEAAKLQQLVEFSKITREISVKEMNPSTDVRENFIALKSWLQDRYMSIGRPLSILMDVTCIPKTYVLYILGLGFAEELVARLDCLYAQGTYDLLANDSSGSPSLSGPRSLLSEGEWFSRQIPYLEAADYIADDCDILVTLGGELGLTLPFIERYEPRRLGLVFISETAPGGAQPMLSSERLAYEELLSEPNARRTDLPVCDAIAVASHAYEFAKSSVARGVTGIAIGSKPHAIGLGLAALATTNMEIVCRTPAAYRQVNVAPTGRLMIYEIEDRFDPTSYLRF